MVASDLSTTYQVIYLLLGGLGCTIGTALFIWSLIQLNRNRHSQYFIKRRPLFTISTLVGDLMILIGISIYTIFEPIANLHRRNNNTMKIISDTLYWTGWVLASFQILCPTLVFIRIWLLYYDMQLSQLLKNQTWQMAINPEIVSRNWFINHKNQRRFGHKGIFLYFGAIILTLTSRTFFTVVEFGDQDNSMLEVSIR